MQNSGTSWVLGSLGLLPAARHPDGGAADEVVNGGKPEHIEASWAFWSSR